MYVNPTDLLTAPIHGLIYMGQQNVMQCARQSMSLI